MVNKSGLNALSAISKASLFNVKFSDVQNDTFIYKSAKPYFSLRTFVEQFFVQTFKPFSNIYMVRRYGKQSAINQVPSPLFRVTTQFFWIVALLYFVFRKELVEHGISSSEVYICLIVGVLFRIVVSLKYASMTNEEYIEFLTCEDAGKVKIMQKQMQLITGWMFVDVSFCAHETKLSMARMGLKGKKGEVNRGPPCFQFTAAELPTWEKLCGISPCVMMGEKTGDPADQKVFLGVVEAVALIVSSSHPPIKPKAIAIVLMPLIVIFCLLPGIVRVSCPQLAQYVTHVDDAQDLCTSNQFLGDGALANTFSILLIVHNYFFSFPINLFLAASTMGALRDLQCCRTFGDLIRSDTRSPDIDTCPILDLSVANNIRAWVRSRLALQFFGRRFIRRTDLFIGVFAAVLMAMLIWLYVYARELVGEDGQGGVNELILDIRYWVICFLVGIWGTAFAGILIIQAATNQELQRHEIEFLLHRLTVRENRHASSLGHVFSRNSSIDDPAYAASVRQSASEFTSDNSAQKAGILSDGAVEGAELEGLDDLMDTAVVITEAQVRINPRRFLNMDSSWRLVASYFAIWGLLIGFTLSAAGIDYAAD